jgi:uncharacterized protein
MKYLLISVFCLSFLKLHAQDNPVKVVFDITSKDTLTHQTVVRHVYGMATAYPGIQLEVVIYGGALPMVMTEKSTTAAKIQELLKNQNITFKACEGTMKRYNISKAQLLPGVATVPDALMEIVKRQGEGWGYIKEVQN